MLPLTIKKIWKKAKHVNLRNTIQDSNPTHQKLSHMGIEDIHTPS